MTKIMALVLAVMMVLGVATAFAESTIPTKQTVDAGNAVDADGKYTISVPDTDSHTYSVYQVLTGSLIAGESKLGNPKWGANASTTAGDVNDFITAIKDLTGVALTDKVEDYVDLSSDALGTVTKDRSLDVVPGYYLIVDTTPKTEIGDDTYSLNIVAVFNDITIAAKADKPSSEKHVDDVNDSNATDKSEKKDSADYDFGDSIPYTLTFTLPADYANYKQYYVNFVDDMSAGLTWDGSATIHYGSSDTEGSSITFTKAESGSSYKNAEDTETGSLWTYEIKNLKAAAFNSYNLKGGDVITINYSATLNSDAVIGSAGNPNKYQVEYSRNPNEEGDGTPDTGKTPWDINIVFTYKAVFNKVDPDGKALTGADFTLYKKVVDDSEAGFKWVDVTELNGEGKTSPSKTVSDSAAVEAQAAVGTEGEDGYKPAVAAQAAVKDSVFTFSGLDAGDYKLSETITPTGYNTIADIEFTITATHELTGDNPALTALTTTGGLTLTGELATGKVETDIENNQGAVLPSTGGQGTTLFYLGGGLLALVAVVLLVTKRRVGTAD